MPSSPFMLSQMAGFPSFLQLNNIPLYIYHIFFIHSSVDGHLGCYHILANVNNATMNTGVHVSFWISVFVSLGYIHKGVELLGYMVVLFLIFWESSALFTTVAAPIYIPTKVYEGSLFSTLSPICYLWSFWWWPFWQVWGDISLWFFCFFVLFCFVCFLGFFFFGSVGSLLLHVGFL